MLVFWRGRCIRDARCGLNVDIGCLGVNPDTCKTTYCTLHERSSKDRVQTAHLSLAPKKGTPLFSQLHCPPAICDSSNEAKRSKNNRGFDSSFLSLCSEDEAEPLLTVSASSQGVVFSGSRNAACGTNSI